MITRLEHSSEKIAEQIFTVFQNSYKIEAQLLGALDFPPLSRSAKHIQTSTAQFYSYIENNHFAGVIEIAIKNERLDINSLTVDPKYFRKGIASKLINYVLEIRNISEAMVETAVANLPAINLYEKHGFVEFKRWTPSHGIEKLALSVKTPT